MTAVVSGQKWSKGCRFVGDIDIHVLKHSHMKEFEKRVMGWNLCRMTPLGEV